MSLRAFLAVLALATAGRSSSTAAEILELPLSANRPAELILDSALDDTNYRDPRGYHHHGTASRNFQRRLTLTNTGSVPLTGPLLVINDTDWNSPEALRRSLNLNGPARDWMPRLFTFWFSHISHAGANLEGGKEPCALLNFWGYALCGDTTAALARLATEYGVPARKIPLNGHVATEYFYDAAWHIFDPDQNVCYLQLDNRTLASAADLRADPLLARRTKALGRYAAMDPAAIAFNTALHEFVDPQEAKPVKNKTPVAPVRAETLFPGEILILHSAQAPERALEETPARRLGSVRENALRLIEFVLKPKARSTAKEGGVVVFASGYPILQAVNHTTGETFSPPAGQAIFEISIKFRTPGDEISVYGQRSNASLPRLRKGRNIVLLTAADSGGRAQLDVEWERPPPALVAPSVTTALADPAPTFQIQSQPAGEVIWWQVSATADFAFVPPNFDAIIPTVERVSFDPLTTTLLNPGQPYFFRAKSRYAGVWSEWSAALAFRVDKPARPAPVQTTVAESRLRLTWPDAGEGCEYLVFGSNRLDFLPEPYAAEEIVALREQVIEQTRPNKNLVATVTKPEIELEPSFRFYRVLTRRAGLLSVPGDLITTPAALATNLPPALVLQDRWSRVADPKNPGAETDAHRATETPLR